MSETPEMVERVARALALSDGGTMVGNSQSKATREFGWDGSNTNAMHKYVEAHWKQFVHAAGFAIEAMRHPTKAMCDVAHEQFDWGPGYDNAPFGAARPETVFPAMIDAALKPPETQTKTGL